MTDPPNPLEEYLEQHADGRRVHKWAHYLDVYERHLAQYRGRPITMLEIGVQSGGSLRMWRDYFGPAARVVGVDIDPRCARLEDPDTTVVIGDQEDPRFMASLAERFGPFDVVIDDGGHTMAQQARTLEVLWPAIRTGGVLIVVPAGEVSSLDPGTRTVVDPAWHPSVARLILLSRAPVLPVYFAGSNSPLFHAAGLLHPRLRTALLPREFLNKRKAKFNPPGAQ